MIWFLRTNRCNVNDIDGGFGQRNSVASSSARYHTASPCPWLHDEKRPSSDHFINKDLGFHGEKMSDPVTHWYDRNEIEKYAQYWRAQKNAKYIDYVKPKTMLHQETLTLLDYFSGRAQHGVLEIGPYTGYSTVIMAKALIGDIPMVTVEVGGSYDHPQLPSQDIVADLKKNLAQEGVSDRVSVVEGHSNDERVKQSIRQTFSSGCKIDLLVIDADGDVGRDINAFEDLLVDGAVIMCDDYDLPKVRDHDGGAELKKGLTSSWIDEAVKSGRLKELGVYRWATWFGQYVKQS